MAQYAPIMEGMPVLLHGADYNPEQWMNDKDRVWPMDMALAQKSGINTLSIGIFAWAMLEPEEGKYDFSWLDEVMDNLAAHGIKAVLATPSGARPAWMAEKYPEVLRVTEDRRRQLFGERHNHCMSSPVYREKVRQINTLLAERYGDHPALGMWHISNEYGGECHCPLCQERFRAWLRERYGTIDRLNDAWWNAFWSHRYASFEQIESPSTIGEGHNHGLALNWKRFTTAQFCDFYRWEIEPLKAIAPRVPATTNLMHTYEGINSFELGRLLDRSSWDNYPMWTGDARDAEVAAHSAFCHDLMRGVGRGKPFMLMESSPSAVNWQAVNRLRAPGLLMLQSLQAIAHGSDTVQYFQFRKGRGSSEKFHGAVVSHDEREDNRVFRAVCEVGRRLKQIQPVEGSAPENKVAVVYDWENRWALEDAFFGLKDKGYTQTVAAHHRALMMNGMGVDVIDETCPLEDYRLVVAPMTYMLRPGYAQRVRAFVEKGGVYVSTYVSGWVDEEDLCFMGGFPGPLKEVAGYWDEETDALDEGQRNAFTWNGKRYVTKDFSALVRLEGAQALAVYEENFYKGYPALTAHGFGKGKFYFMAARAGLDFLKDFYEAIGGEAGVTPLVRALPYGLLATERVGEKARYLFVMNTLPEPAAFDAPQGYARMSGGEDGALPPYGVAVYTR